MGREKHPVVQQLYHLLCFYLPIINYWNKNSGKEYTVVRSAQLFIPLIASKKR